MQVARATMSATLAYQQPQKSPAKLDTLSRILAELCQPGASPDLPGPVAAQDARCSPASPDAAHAGFQERKDDHILRDFVDSEARYFVGERFDRFAVEMNQRLKSLIRR